MHNIILIKEVLACLFYFLSVYGGMCTLERIYTWRPEISGVCLILHSTCGPFCCWWWWFLFFFEIGSLTGRRTWSSLDYLARNPYESSWLYFSSIRIKGIDHYAWLFSKIFLLFELKYSHIIFPLPCPPFSSSHGFLPWLLFLQFLMYARVHTTCSVHTMLPTHIF